MDGGSGDDILSGGAARDTFVFAAGHGTARITDFEDGTDIIDLAAFGFTDADAAKIFAMQAGSDVVFTFAPGNALTIGNITLTQLTDSDFILV